MDVADRAFKDGHNSIFHTVLQDYINTWPFSTVNFGKSHDYFDQ